MATVSSLFGLSPEQILSAQFQRQQQENALRQQQLMQGGQEFGIYAPLYRAGLQLSDVGSRAAMQGLFGPQQDPQLAKAVDVRRIIGGRNVFDPAELQNVVNDLSAAGYIDEARAVEAEGRKRGIQEREMTLREQETAARIKATEESAASRAAKVTTVGTTINGLTTYRKGDNPQIYVTNNEGQEEEYDPKKHGRFETRQDAISERGVQIRDIPGPGGIGVIGREIFDNRGNVVRREYLPGYGPNAAAAPSAPAAANKPGRSANANRPPLSSFGAP